MADAAFKVFAEELERLWEKNHSDGHPWPIAAVIKAARKAADVATALNAEVEALKEDRRKFDLYERTMQAMRDDDPDKRYTIDDFANLLSDAVQPDPQQPVDKPTGMEVLLPCPFCGAPPGVNSQPSPHYVSGEFHTRACACGGNVSKAWVGASTKEEADLAWNTRSTQKPIDAEKLAVAIWSEWSGPLGNMRSKGFARAVSRAIASLRSPQSEDAK